MAVERATKEEYQFFGEFEKHGKFGFTSEYPSWSMTKQIEDLKEEIASLEDALDYPNIPNKRERRQVLLEKKTRLAEIEASRPKLSDKQKDDLGKVRAELLEEIKRTGFTRDDMRTGRADAHEVAKRGETPFIKVSKEIADACGVRLVKGQATRDGAAKIFKVLSRVLVEDGSSHNFYKD